MPQRTIVSPIGQIRLVSQHGRIAALTIDPAPEPDLPGDDAVLDSAAQQLAEYFSGGRERFDLPIAPVTTPRGAALRAAICAIPHGQTARYGALAAQIGSGARAVGQACARNPIPVIIPCHRVLASNGLGNYSGGGGIRTKQWLLAHEAGDLWA
jgi:methylated-DNA-[protein]-cysteine S-methyltransferase